MAKRKRLTPANPAFTEAAEAPPAAARAPIADVARDSSASAALSQLSQEMAEARSTGRMIAALPLDTIRLDYLVRDRLVVDDDEMSALITSIRERGQQTPVEVVRLEDGQYGLISGWRRCQAIAHLHDHGVGDGTVLALERHPDTTQDAYRAMVEENEIRSGLSYFERARIVDVSVQNGVFDSHKTALQSLFASASRAKRSKIGSFVILVQLLGDRLFFPAAIGERLGLRLARIVDLDGDEAEALAEACAGTRHDTPEAETAFLAAWAERAERAEKARNAPAHAAKPSRPAPQVQRPRPDLQLRFHAGERRLELSGAGVTDELRAALADWLAKNSKPDPT